VARIAAEALVERLIDWGVDTVFGLPGDGINGIMEGLRRTAYARRGVAHITVPNDIQVADAGADPWQHVTPASAPRTAAVRLPPPGLPSPQDLQLLADFLNEGTKIGILAGAGAVHARAELIAVAEALDAPIVKTLPGKAAVPDDSPYTTGGIGLLGTKASEDLMDEIDTLLMVGTNFPYTKHLPQGARCAQIEADPARAGARIPTDVPVVGDAQQTLQALLPLLKQRTEHEFLAKYTREMNAWRRNMAALAFLRGQPHRATIATTLLADRIQQLGG
jgi:pyruvate dehydrogenase (quinone)